MTKDPNYYLQRAKFYYDRASNNSYDSEIEYIDDDIIVDDIDNNEYEYIPFDQVVIDNVVDEKINIINNKATKSIQRYYDPITKHYYKNNKILTNEEDKSISKIIEMNAEVWYPENKLRYKTVRDIKTGKYYRVNKIYDDKGKYFYTYDRISNEMHKLPGTNYYQPVYRKIQKQYNLLTINQ